MSVAKTALLLAVMTALFLAVGAAIGGQQGLIIALLIAVAMNGFAYWNSDKMVLSMYGARQVDHTTAPHLVSMVERLSRRAGLPMPKVFIIDNDQPNAFATGRDPEHASVAATTGLLESLTAEEVEGVMAHELAHVKNRDTLIMTVTATISGAIGMLGTFALFFGGSRDNNGNGNPLGMVGTLLAMIVAPLAASLVQMAISRTREYAADKMGGEICGNPLALAAALERLESASHAIQNPQAERSPATAHMFIINPLNGKGMDNLFSTHPKTANRIAALQQQAREQGVQNAGSSAAPSAPVTPRGPWG